MKHYYKLLIGTVLLMFLFAGCTQDTPTEVEVIEDEAAVEEEVEIVEETKEPEEERVEVVEEEKIVDPGFGGLLRIAMSPADNLDPIENRISNVSQVLGLIFEPLFALDQTLTPQPILVGSYNFDASGRQLNLTLKDNILFHDGNLLTTDDVAYTIDKIKDSKTSPYRVLVASIKRYSISDQSTITLYYDEGHAFVLQDLSFPILSKVYEESDVYDEMKPIGSGPYRMSDYQDMQRLDLVANTSWHGGDVYIEQIQATVMNETESLEDLFDQHLIDVMTPRKFNWLKYSEKEDQRIGSYMSTYYDFIGFNFENEWLQDVDFRKAIAHSIDRESILYNSFINHGALVDAPIVPDSWFDTDNEITYNFDMDFAKNLINPVIYKDVDGDGFYDEADIVDNTQYETIELSLLVNEQAAHRVAVAPLIKESIESLGFLIHIESVDAQTYYERVSSKDFDLLLGGWKLAPKPDYDSLLSSQGLQNYFGYQSESMDQLIRSINSTYDQELVKELVRNFEALMIEDMPYVSLYFLEGAVMSHGNVYGDLVPSSYNMFNEVESLYLDLEAE